MNKVKEPLRSLIAKTWRTRAASLGSGDLAGILDFDRGSLHIDTRDKILSDMTPEIRSIFDVVPHLKRILTPAGEEDPKVSHERALWLVVIEMPQGIALQRLVRD